jgi:nicotinate-nucleotide adenylyltransferase
MASRVGIWGGAFDPIHIGHLLLAQEALEACQLDRIVWVPYGDPPHKAGPVASAADRVRMIELAIQGVAAFTVSQSEVERSGKSYTARTLERVREHASLHDRLFLLIGADNAVDFNSWLEPDRVLELADVIVFRRRGISLDKVPITYRAQMKILNTPLFEVSSTAIRNRLASGASIQYWVPDSVRQFIESNRLYFESGANG